MNHSPTKETGRLLQLSILGVASILCMMILRNLLLSKAEDTRQITMTQKLHKSAHRLYPKPKPYEFPGGGKELFPKYRLVALYGTPSYPALGALGEQGPEAAVQRVKELAKVYQPYATEQILPAFEIITTIASASATDNGDYSQELDIAALQPWIAAAKQHGVYVVLDLQPGRTDFLTQAKQYESLLREPNVGLALDPEWRLEPTQLPLRQIGSVDIDEVNLTAQWLADLTQQYKLPQKLFLLHQFQLAMIRRRELLNTNYKQLAYVIQMDGQGSQSSKLDTWNTITANPPPNVRFGWKNFYTKDSPTLDPATTMQRTPQPHYVSYQ